MGCTASLNRGHHAILRGHMNRLPAHDSTNDDGRCPAVPCRAAPAAKDHRPLGSAPPHQLGRTLKRRHIALIGLGGVVGAGLFVGSSASINAVGPAVVLSYLAAGAIVYALMALLGELANAYRGIQAFPDLVRAAGGPALGFMIGWAYWSLWTIAIAIEALAGAGLLQNYIPLPTGALSALVVLVMMGINLLPTRTYGELEFWLSSVKVLAIILFVAIA